MPIRPEDIAAAQAVQFAAAHAPEAHVRLVAGPGSGKSLTIEERVRWLLESGIAPRNIAVVSFTNASVIDLRLRLHSYCALHFQAGIEEVSITTLHSLALRMLRQAGLLAAYPTRPLVLDDWELETIYDAEFGKSHNIPSKPRREEIRAFYEAFWSTGVVGSPTYVQAEPPVTEEERRQFELFHQPTAAVYSAVLPGEIVRKCVDAATTGVIEPAKLLGITHLIVDEYQDLNPADIEFIDQLAAAQVKLFVAGDDDQSIYSFRHASPSGIQNFPAKYPAAGKHALQHCFRCTPAVLQAATHLILNNAAPSRIAKTLVSLYRDAVPPNDVVAHRWRFPSASAEATGIAASCAALIAGTLVPKEILILLSNRKLWPLIQTALEDAGVPFDPPGEEGFSVSDAGRLVLSITRIVCSRDEDGHPEDLVAHRTILGLRRGIGVSTCDKIRLAIIETPNLSLLDLFEKPLPEGLFTTKAVTALTHARAITTPLADWEPTDTLGSHGDEIVAMIRSTLVEGGDEGIAAWLAFRHPLPDDTLISELRDYLWVDTEPKRAEVRAAIRKRLELPEEENAATNRVRVMTMHSAKGLSSQVVFIPGLETGFMPNNRQLRSPAQRLEAARLLFVSITRARAACIMSLAQRRTVNGQWTRQAPSPFATQTGGAFADGGAGLTTAQTQAILQSVANLY